MGIGELRAAGMAVAALLAVLQIAPGTGAQMSTPSCAEQLIPCASYLGATKPSESCCGQLRETIQNELPCLCSLLGNTQLLQAFQVNLTQALELPMHCGITSGHSICGAVSPAAPEGKNRNGAAVARVGFSGLMGFLVLWSSLV